MMIRAGSIAAGEVRLSIDRTIGRGVGLDWVGGLQHYWSTPTRLGQPQLGHSFLMMDELLLLL